MDLVLFYIASAFYFVATLQYIVYVATRRLLMGQVATWATAVGFAFHTLSLAAHIGAAGRAPVGSPYEVVSSFAWAVILLYLVVELRSRTHVAGAFVLPLAVLAMYAAAASREHFTADIGPAMASMWVWAHVTLAVFGNAAFVITSAAGLMYLLQERQLKAKRPGGRGLPLPSLETLDRWSYLSLSVGFPLLTLGILMGFIRAGRAWGSYFAGDPRQIWSVITWLIYGTLLAARFSAGWRGRKAALLSVAGFAAVLLTFGGVHIFSRGLHAF
ncbi:MAG TPA: cytochrome c biogenesis protein CcsA [Candidatus Sulfotelmatobacter sp.]|nr:cytochrome c biogenesis protein CcsA [Candidatus Sulfotelmatobacter sp.]